ncbi:MAG: nucleotidyltransferase domain-containing protein [Bacteroidales bacterium]
MESTLNLNAISKQIGISVECIELIRSVFAKHSSINEVLIYGHRATGNYTSNSPIYLAIRKSLESYNELETIRTEIELLDLLYEINLIDKDLIKNKELTNQITKDGILLYARDEF